MHLEFDEKQKHLYKTQFYEKLPAGKIMLKRQFYMSIVPRSMEFIMKKIFYVTF